MSISIKKKTSWSTRKITLPDSTSTSTLTPTSTPDFISISTPNFVSKPPSLSNPNPKSSSNSNPNPKSSSNSNPNPKSSSNSNSKSSSNSNSSSNLTSNVVPVSSHSTISSTFSSNPAVSSTFNSISSGNPSFSFRSSFSMSLVSEMTFSSLSSLCNSDIYGTSTEGSLIRKKSDSESGGRIGSRISRSGCSSGSTSGGSGLEVNESNIRGIYDQDLNLQLIDSYVIELMEKKKINDQERIQKELKLELEKVKKPQTLTDRKCSNNRIVEFQKKLEDYRDNRDLIKYQQETENLLTEYQKIGVKIKKKTFGSSNTSNTLSSHGSEKEPNEQGAKDLVRENLILEYLRIARKYVDLDLRKMPVKLKNRCKMCDFDLSKDQNMTVEGLLVCSNCGAEYVRLCYGPIDDDDKPTSNLEKSKNSDERENFIKRLHQYLGQICDNNPPTEDLYLQLDRYFSERQIPTRFEIIQNEFTTKDVMYLALKKTKNNKFYKDLNFICHQYWGLPLPDIGNLENIIIKDYDDFRDVYLEIKGDERSSSLNAQYLLWRLLFRRGHKCKPTDFKIVKTPEILAYHEKIYFKACEILSWETPIPIEELR